VKAHTTVNPKLGSGVAIQWEDNGASYIILLCPGDNALLEKVNAWIGQGYTAEQIAMVASAAEVPQFIVLRWKNDKKNDLPDGTASGEIFNNGTLARGERYKDDAFVGFLSADELSSRVSQLRFFRQALPLAKEVAAKREKDALEKEAARKEREIAPLDGGLRKDMPFKGTFDFTKPPKTQS